MNPFNPAASQSQDTLALDALIAGDTDSIISEKITLITGQNLARGAVLGKITASGEYTLSLSAAVDGSQVPDRILAQDCDATAADTDALVYRTGRFNDTAIILGAAHTVASVTEGLRGKGIQLQHATPA